MLKIIAVVFISIHGLIHFIGFMKAYNLGQVTQITKDVTKPKGVLWLLAALLLLLTAIAYFIDFKLWWAVGCVGLILSQILIISAWQDAKFGSIANGFLLCMVILGYAGYSFYLTFQNDTKKYLQGDAGRNTELLTEADITHLPQPVQKYLQYVGCIGKPKVYNFRGDFDGKIRKNDQADWMPFHSTQYNFMTHPARLFFMNAVMKKLPVAGYHCYKNGNAFMDIRLFSLWRVQFMKGNEMDTAETVTFFNDMCVMAPSTLIDPRIKWLEVSGNNVKACFVNESIQVTAWLYFNDTGELINFSSEDRYNFDVGKKAKWSTPLKDYKMINGYRIATSAEVVYQYPQGDVVYGAFLTKSISYNTNEVLSR